MAWELIERGTCKGNIIWNTALRITGKQAHGQLNATLQSYTWPPANVCKEAALFILDHTSIPMI